ncbi:MAG: DUF4349 domain-containing protein [Deltaproteobacteria bacterium]|nr:DUF4349 domain-containing protein [Deltaproteobacteria bacterium]
MRRIALIAVLGPLVFGCGMSSSKYALAGSAPMMSPAPVATSTGGAPAAMAGGGGSTMQIPEAMVIEGSIALEVGEINDIVPALRAQVEAIGGRVINESISGGERSWSAHLKLRLPPAKVEEVVAFLAKRGDILSKNVSATDVSKQMFDQELAIKNLRTTLDRLTQLMATGGLQVPQILQIEQEMTRIRGQIDALEGEHRFLKDRVALATLDVSIARRDGAVIEVTVAKAKAYPGARAVMLTLFDPGNRKRTRYGGGFVLHTVLRTVSLEVDLFQKEQNAAGDSSSNAVIATLGGATYSDFLGGGKRQFVNPYLGFRLGYAYLDSSRFVLQGEAGVELFKAKYMVIDANVRATGLLGGTSDLGLVAGAGATVAF